MMINNVTKTRLAVAEASGYVIACGYNALGIFGYFICRETICGDPPTYTYHSFEKFTPKRNEYTFQAVLTELRSLAKDTA